MSQEGQQSPAVSAETRIDALDSQKTSPGKTPIQILHEYGTKSGNLPVYVMEKAEGMAHHPSFIFSVSIGEVSCRGQGSSKKAAKHMAAEAALHMLNIDPGIVNVPVKSDSNGTAPETNSHLNSVGILQELALQRGWRLPEYSVLREVGPPHQREFTVTCRVETLSEKAVANSKKSAKKASAEKMLAKLQSLSGCSEITWVRQTSLSIHDLGGRPRHFKSVCVFQTPTPSVRFENIRNSTAEKISLLRRNPLSIPNTDYIQMMLELSKEQGFEVTYFDIDELTVNGQYQCLAELSTSPVTVCHGTGISCSNAHNDAAHSALQYVKIMAAGQ
ncbi:interferon-inducible double-stranded RNA-dependent protein kinase activator A homolog isoform X1 [Salarias fasciatus]|uniref:interferon-inducible double-stranded RNA-dependent protein kinase activator A homolog isoform X1 n=1 Tax=Salarias fasciatus TaxID=181472 RepID=UPI0011769077|nr:interferon-inducible double-stranded RNA-dependent protein kinase activator A isoform X1 [Salarias fasciatus]